jgi:large subunit ribosomal protein L31
MSSVETESTDTWTDGKEYPMYQVEISSASHPFYTGKEANVEKAGRAEKFRARAAQAKKAPVKKAAAEPATETPAEESTEA